MQQPDLQPSAPTPEQLCSLFDGYEVTRFIAVGGMGAIYHAKQEDPEREVAIKLGLMDPAEHPELKEQFENEIQAMKALDHSHIIRLFDSGEVEGMPYIIMEYVEGDSLFSAIGGHPIEPLQAAEITLQVCQALSHTHQRGILHRDIKPENLILTPDCTVKIADFGLAQNINRPQEDAIAWGSPGYSAPEVVMTPDTIDPRTDVYSVGCLLYSMLTGSPPDPNALDLECLSWCDRRFKEFIQRCMLYQQDHRFQSCDELSEDLTELIYSLQQDNSTGALLQAEEKPFNPADLPDFDYNI